MPALCCRVVILYSLEHAESHGDQVPSQLTSAGQLPSPEIHDVVVPSAAEHVVPEPLAVVETANVFVQVLLQAPYAPTQSTFAAHEPSPALQVNVAPSAAAQATPPPDAARVTV